MAVVIGQRAGEQAAAVLVQLGVAAVIAPSFSGLYFRNAFNVGLLLLTCERAAEIADIISSENGSPGFSRPSSIIATTLSLSCR